MLLLCVDLLILHVNKESILSPKCTIASCSAPVLHYSLAIPLLLKLLKFLILLGNHVSIRLDWVRKRLKLATIYNGVADLYFSRLTSGTALK